MIVHGVQARPLARVPYPHRVVPAAGDEEVRDLRVPHQPPHGAGVPTENTDAGILSIIPDANRTGTEHYGSKTIRVISYLKY